MPLTNTAIQRAKPAAKSMRLFDEKGLYLEVAPSGGKWWRLKYRYQGKEKRLSLGVYPDVSLKDARDRRDAARKQVANGIDPSGHRKATKSANAESATNSFEIVAREWLAKFSNNWVSTYSVKVQRRFESDLFPWLGSRPIAEIRPQELLKALRRIEERGAKETARRALSECGQLFRYAVATGRVESDPTRDLKGALAMPTVRHMPSITDPVKVGELLRAIEGYQGTFVTKCALRLAPLLFVRPGELRKAEWSEFDLDAATWTIPAARMKTRKQNPQDHMVPLAMQAVGILRELHQLTGAGRYVFPGARTSSRPMSENTINAGLRRLGYGKDEIVGHGFRAMARTILDEELGFRPEVVEAQLAHSVRDPQGRAYNRTGYLIERRRMMQAWADCLDKLRTGADVIPLHGSAA